MADTDTIDPAPRITALAPWFGSKRNLAPEIVRELGPHAAYWEPFCGSCAVLLAKPPASMETVNDLNGDLINLARVLKNEQTAQELWRRLRGMLMHEDLFHEAAARWRARGQLQAPGSPDVDAAEDYMVCSWIGRNGVAGTDSYNQGFCLRYTKNGGHAATRWRSAVESIPKWHERLLAVTITNRCAFALISRIEDSPGLAIYVDPPYVEKGANYIHDFGRKCTDCGVFHDHEQLASLLGRFERARVVVSYYDHPEIRRLYDGWMRRSIEVTKAMASQGARDKDNKIKATEVLLMNGPSNAAERGLFGESEAPQ